MDNVVSMPETRQTTILDGDKLAQLSADIEVLKDEKAELAGIIVRLRGENIESSKQIKQQLGLLQLKFNSGPRGEEGTFDLIFDRVIESIPPLKAKDIMSYATFQKKVLGLTGKMLPDVDQTAWKLFLQDNIQGLNSLL